MKLSKQVKLLAVPAVIIGSMFAAVDAARASSLLTTSAQPVEASVNDLSKERLLEMKSSDVAADKGFGNRKRRGRRRRR